MEDQPLRLQTLFQRALIGDLYLQELIDEWRTIEEHHPILRELYEDIEDSVEHLPAGKQGEIDFDFWRKTEIYKKTYLDFRLIESLQSYDEIAQARNKFFASNINLTMESINAYVSSLGRVD